MKDADDGTREGVNGAVGGERRFDDSVNHLLVYEEREDFTDCTGAKRQFDLTIHDIPGGGFSAHAHEVTSATDGGYVFRAIAEASYSLALGRLRGKVRAGLAQRFLIHDGHHLDMPLDRLCGHIDPDGVVVDGRLLDWTSFQSLLQSYEGWDFELRIPFEQ